MASRPASFDTGGCEMIRRGATILLVTAAILAILPMAPASADVPVSVSTEDLISLEAAAPAQGTCNLTLVISFTGYRDQNGIVNGTWSHYASTVCNLQFGWNMDYLWVRDSLHKGGVQQHISVPNYCYECESVLSSGSMYCPYCNGSWVGKSEHIMKFPFIIEGFVASKPGGCTAQNLKTIKCNLQTAPLIL